ncbi:MAG: hypothetical protein K0M63_09500 [Weeksellaceae bacterium]|nr:hypothetical protein [Weeksellaceae bacterium]
MKRFILPAAVILIGAGSAFATGVAKEKNATIVQGFRYDPAAPGVKCIETPVDCSTTEGPACTWDDGVTTHNLYQFVNETMCGLQLSRIN